MSSLPRVLIWLLAVLAATGAAVEPAVGREEWRFTAMLDGKEIGFQTFSVDHRDADRIVRIEAQFDVTLLFVPVYGYSHRNREVWRDGCLRQIDAETDDNGDRYRVIGRQVGDRFDVEANGERRRLSGCIMSFAYWDPAFLQRTRLLNSQTGDYQAVSIAPLGQEKLKIQRQFLNVRRYRLTAEGMKIDLWYSDEGRWVQLASAVNGDSVLTLKLKAFVDGSSAHRNEP